MKSASVVVSHYNAWPTDKLIALLDQIFTIPAGHPFRCRVVVNQAHETRLVLPERFSDVEVFHRENVGYNIGAWELGWRQDPPADYYLFLQEECQILGPGWLAAFVKRLERPRVGLVGESVFYKKYSWARADHYFRDVYHPRHPDGEGEVRLMDAKREVLATRNIPEGKYASHVQSLVMALRRDVLEAIDGFMIWKSYAYAIGAEFAVSKQVEALGLRVEQIGLVPFKYIYHPQWFWMKSTRRLPFEMIEPYLPYGISNYIRNQHGRSHGWRRWVKEKLGRNKG